MEKITTINSYIPLLKDKVKKLDEETIIEDVIAPNLNAALAVEFLRHGGDEVTKLNDVKKLLKKLEKANNLAQKISASRDRNKKRENESNDKNGKGGKKPNTEGKGDKKKGATKAPDDCRLPGCTHKWKNCPNSPKSEKYSGVHYDIVTSEKSTTKRRQRKQRR